MISQSKFEGELQEFIKPLLDKHHVTRNHKTKFHFVLACYLSRSITQHIISTLPTEEEIRSCITTNTVMLECGDTCRVHQLAKAILSTIKKAWGVKC